MKERYGRVYLDGQCEEKIDDTHYIEKRISKNNREYWMMVDDFTIIKKGIVQYRIRKSIALAAIKSNRWKLIKEN